MAVLIAKSCIGCGSCIPVCPEGALDLGPDNIVLVDKAKCTECEKCIATCPVEAISLPKGTSAEAKKPEPVSKEEQIKNCEVLIESKKSLKIVDDKDKKDLVWVYIEHLEGKIANVSLELIGAATKLAEKRYAKVGVVLLGDKPDCFTKTLFEYGADKIYLMDDPVFKDYRTEAYLEGVCHLVKKYAPEILLIGATTTGRDLAGAVATEMQTGLTADCTQLDIDTDKEILLASRPAFGGNIMATILCENHRPQMATVRPKVMKALEPVVGRKGQLVKESIAIKEESIPKKVLEIVHDSLDSVKLDEAKIIVAGGRGVKDRDGFKLIEELAEVIGGVVAGSRGAVESGCIPVKRQVGQTGQTVAPSLYFAIGISGAVQHVVGIQGSETIIAINNDPNCELMKMATYSIVGDAYKILPKLINEFRTSIAANPKKEAAEVCEVKMEEPTNG